MALFASEVAPTPDFLSIEMSVAACQIYAELIAERSSPETIRLRLPGGLALVELRGGFFEGAFAVDGLYQSPGCEPSRTITTLPAALDLIGERLSERTA